MRSQDCPDEAMLARLVRGELDDPASETVVSHVHGCPSCTTALDLLAAEDSLERLSFPSALSSRTRHLQQQLAASPPTLAPDGSRSAAIPRELPAIPGIADLEARCRGGMGIVYRGRDLALERTVAVKVLWPASAGSHTAWARAKREALLLARISHANVVAVYAAGETGGSPYLVMEWVDGPSLQQRLDTGLPTPRQVARLARDLARAVASVHALGVVHRDIKPDNVLLAGGKAADWDACVPKLADFGLARPTDLSQQLTQDAAALGTPAYMAPEQTGLAPELGEPGPAADIHGLGGLAFALLTGSPPHAAATSTAALQRAAGSEITWPTAAGRTPRDLRAIVEKCLEREPSRRYASADLLADDLHRFIEGLPVRARPVSPLRRLARVIRRRPVVSAAVGMSLIFVAAAIGGMVYHAATIAAARARIATSERHASQTAGAAARSMRRLTGDLVEQMVRRSRPDDTGHIEFLRQIREEFADWPLGDDPREGMYFRVAGLMRVAELFADVSQFDDALACHGLLLDSLDELAAVRPLDSWGISQRLGSLHMQRAFLHHLGRMDEAMASALESIAVLRAAPTDLPDRERELVRATLDLGLFLHEQGRYDEGAARIEEAVERMRKLREAAPADVSLAAQDAHALFTAQLCSWNAGRFDACRRWSEHLVHGIGGFLAGPESGRLAMPERGFLTKMVSLGFNRLVALAERDGHQGDAIHLAQSRRRLCRDYVVGLPVDAVTECHSEWIDADLEAARLLQAADRLQESEATLDEAAEAAASLYDQQPGVWDYASLSARVCQQRAELAVVRGEPDAARLLFARAASLMAPYRATPAQRNETEAQLAAAQAGLDRLGGGSSERLATSDLQSEALSRP